MHAARAARNAPLPARVEPVGCGRLIAFDELQRITGYERLADVERCLERQGIRFFRGKARVWTTLDLINAAAGLAGAGEVDARAGTYPADLVD